MRCFGLLPALLVTALLGCFLLSGCGGSPATLVPGDQLDRQWSSSMQDGRDAFDQGHFLLARRLFVQAVERGRQMDRAEDISDAAFNLAATLIELGDYDAARLALREARSERRRSGEDLGDILLLEAKMARLQGDLPRARTLTDQLLQQLPEVERYLRPQAQLLGGLLACAAGEVAQAEQHLDVANELLAKENRPALSAAQAELLGCIQQSKGHHQEAAVAFDREGLYLKQALQYRQLVTALHRAGTAYAAAGENRLAAERLYRAARSAFSQNRLEEAALFLEQAQSAARSIEDRLLLEDIARLRIEIAH